MLGTRGNRCPKLVVNRDLRKREGVIVIGVDLAL